ncbi:Major capsid protein Gp5 [uncultured Caudovirales phage]|uniref:Major capsid protein Gp5 n=1 Tax=uncultured Caudovirales phage TaxID=2100421 RepID=A0A6J5N348_9CAUD|nr:Major capsid protein Gp5 [uncultured Caudovirales phage]
MSNVLVTSSLVAKEALAILQNMLGFAKNVNRDFQDEFSGNQSRGYSPGQTINIKRPPRYTYRAGRVSVPQATTETSIPLTLSQGGTDLSFTSFERTLSVQQFEQKMQAAVAAVVNEIDRQGLDLARRTVANSVGAVGTLPTTQAAAYALLTQGNQKLDEMAAPRDRQRALVVNPAMNAAVLQGFGGLFNASGAVGKGYETGMYQNAFGLKVDMDQNVARHINGTAVATTNTVNGANQTGSTITVNALNGTLTAGTVLTFAGVNAVNPQSRQDTGSLQQFVVQANAASGATSISVFPAIVTSGAFQTVTASPANSAVITIQGAADASYDANILYHKDAFTLAMVPMFEPMNGTGAKVTQMSDDGFSVKVTQFYDGVNDNNLMRLDVLFGWAATYPELACKVIA